MPKFSLNKDFYKITATTLNSTELLIISTMDATKKKHAASKQK